MPKAKRAAASAQDDSPPVVAVDTTQADTKKAVSRVPIDDDLPEQGEEAAEATERKSKNSDWVARNREVKKRFGRLERKFNQQLADQEARHQRELREVNDRFSSLQTKRQKDDTSADEATHEREMAALQATLEKAMDEGNSKEVARITREMQSKEARFWNAKTQAAMGDGAAAKRDQRADNDRGPPPEQNQRRQPTPAGKAFTSANDWWDDDDYYVERTAANAIFAKMVEEEGADPADAQTYARVAKRLAKKFPELEIVVPGRDDDDDDDDELDDDDGDTRRGAHRRAQEAAVHTLNRRDNGGITRRRGEVHLNDADFKTMRQCGMDPDNNDHCVQFARAKQETAEQERARR